MQTRDALRRKLLQHSKKKWLASRESQYTVLKKAVPVDVIDSFHIALDTKNKHVIFNNPSNDRLRFQIPLDRKQLIVKFVKKIALEHFPKLVLNDPYVLISEPGCQQQVPHCDYDPHTIECVPLDKIPRGAILALQNHTTLEVWENSRVHEYVYSVDKCDQKTIEIQKGDIIFFDGDLVHAGSFYENENARLHVFLDSDLVLRPTDRTFRLNLK